MKKLTDQIAVGPQPSADDLQALARQGFRTIINVRTSGEDGRPLEPEEERLAVTKLGMEYAHIPVPDHHLELDEVDEFCQALSRLPNPVFVHSRIGKRAGTLALLYLACEQGWTEDETLRKAKELALECDEPGVQEFIRGYLETRRS